MSVARRRGERHKEERNIYMYIYMQSWAKVIGRKILKIIREFYSSIRLSSTHGHVYILSRSLFTFLKLCSKYQKEKENKHGYDSGTLEIRNGTRSNLTMLGK